MMKSKFLVVVILLIQFALQKQEEDYRQLDGRSVEKYIRARGSYLISAAKIKEGNSTKLIEEQQKENQQLELFDNQKIEVPLLCQPQYKYLSIDEYASLAYAGESLQKCWVKAADEDEENYEYDNMPILNMQQLLSFYDCATQNKILKAEELSGSQSQSIAQTLLYTLNYQNMYRSDLTWLEFMLYTCAKGAYVPQQKYMINPNSEESLLVNVVQSLDKQNQQNKARIDDLKNHINKKLAALTKPYNNHQIFKSLGLLHQSLQEVFQNIFTQITSLKMQKKIKYLKIKQQKLLKKTNSKRFNMKKIKHKLRINHY